MAASAEEGSVVVVVVVGWGFELCLGAELGFWAAAGGGGGWGWGEGFLEGLGVVLKRGKFWSRRTGWSIVVWLSGEAKRERQINDREIKSGELKLFLLLLFLFFKYKFLIGNKGAFGVGKCFLFSLFENNY